MDALLVSRDPEVMSGALCFRGTRVPVKNLFDYLGHRRSGIFWRTSLQYPARLPFPS
jgi:uncharacterized protein (DUF433 family)